MISQAEFHFQQQQQMAMQQAIAAEEHEKEVFLLLLAVADPSSASIGDAEIPPLGRSVGEEPT